MSVTEMSPRAQSELRSREPNGLPPRPDRLWRMTGDLACRWQRSGLYLHLYLSTHWADFLCHEPVFFVVKKKKKKKLMRNDV